MEDVLLSEDVKGPRHDVPSQKTKTCGEEHVRLSIFLKFSEAEYLEYIQDKETCCQRHFVRGAALRHSVKSELCGWGNDSG